MSNLANIKPCFQWLIFCWVWKWLEALQGLCEPLSIVQLKLYQGKILDANFALIFSVHSFKYFQNIHLGYIRFGTFRYNVFTFYLNVLQGSWGLLEKSSLIRRNMNLFSWDQHFCLWKLVHGELSLLLFSLTPSSWPDTVNSVVTLLIPLPWIQKSCLFFFFNKRKPLMLQWCLIFWAKEASLLIIS